MTTNGRRQSGRAILLALLLVGGFAIILFRLVNLQILRAAELTARADRQHEKFVTLEGARGTITDRQGKVLAINVDVPSVFGVPASLDDPEGSARRLAHALHMRADELERKLKQDRSFVWIARKLDPEQGRRVAALSLNGVGMVLEGRRFYPKESLLSHVLGFAGMDGQGLEGLERKYDADLRGEKHLIALERDALGRTVFPKGLGDRTPSRGHDLTLTIDEFIQYVAEKELESGVLAAQAKSGIAIVMEPRSGAVLAMALHPKFDPNMLGSMSAERWRNRAITDAYEPGSTMKVLVAAAAIEEKTMRADTRIFAEHGRLEVGSTIIHDHEKSGWITLAQAIQRSSNIGAVKIAMSLGENRLFRYLKAFGFGERSGIDLPGEATGLLRERRAWGRRSLASMAIGQEVGVTALQLVTAVSAVANGGALMKPYLVSEIRDAKGDVIARAEPQVRRRPITPLTARLVTEILEGVVAKGTGTRAAVPGYRVAGKTGTAQKIDPRTGGYSSTLFVGSFVGYVPAEDPQLTIAVVIDEPQAEAWGGVVAAPVFKKIAEQVLPYIGVSPRQPVTVVQAKTA